MFGRRRAWLLLLFACVLALAGCAPILRAEQTALEQVVALSAGERAGQSLKASYAGLNGAAFYLNPATEQPPSGVLHLQLKAAQDSGAVLAQADLPLSQVDGPGYYRFDFPVQPGSTQADYYLALELDGSGRLDLGSAPGDTYLNGAAYANDEPIDAQLAFQLAYEPFHLVGGLLLEGLNWLVILLGAGFLLVLPGWALLASLLPAWRGLRWPEKTILSAGVGLALYPLLFLWARLVHFAPGAGWAWGPGALALVFLVVRTSRQQAFQGRAFWRFSVRHWPADANFWPDLVFGLVAFVIFAARFWAIRSIDVPLWGDSYQHTMIAQRIIEAGGLFDSWQPYVPYSSLTVQYGFPALSALWAWLSGQSAVQSILVMGQIVNSLAVLALYPLAVWLSRGNRWAGSFTILTAGLLLQIPAIYVNWGRYAQLSGQAVLPVALVLLGSLAQRQGRVRPGEMVVNSLVAAGMMLHYYRMAFYYAAFVPLVLLQLIPLLRQRFVGWKERLLAMVAVAALALVLLLPWFSNLTGSNLTGMVEQGASGQSPSSNILDDYLTWQTIQQYIPMGMLLATGLAVLAAMAMRRWMVAGLVLWLGLLSAVRLGMFIGLPGANMMQSFAVIIFLYAPVALILGWLAGEVACLAEVRLQRLGRMGILLAVLLAVFLGFQLQKNVADPNTYAIATRPDVRAMQWIRENTVRDSVFLVEGFSLYRGTTAVGSDGGWWIALLAGRQNTMPPQYALMNEQPVDPGYTRAVVDLVKLLEQRPWTQATLAGALCDWKITHVYIGQRVGQASLGQNQLFSVQDFADWPRVYARDRVRIFAVPDTLCR